MFQCQFYKLIFYSNKHSLWKIVMNKIMLQNYILGSEFVKLCDYLFICKYLLNFYQLKYTILCSLLF